MSGFSPIKEDIVLTRDADFVHRYQVSDQLLPVGTSAEIVITKDAGDRSPVLATWPAETVTPEYIDFWVDFEETNLIAARRHYRLMVHYSAVAPSTEVQDFCWYRGNVKREQ